MYIGRGTKRAYREWLRDMVMDSVGNEERSVTTAVLEKLKRNTRPASPDREDLRPWRTTNE